MRKVLVILTMCLALTVSAMAQVTVTGRVTGEDGLGIPGASVLEQGTTNGTVTNADGAYTLRVGSNASIVFSFMGYASQEIPLQGRTAIDVTLVPSSLAVDEVVVTALGIRREARALGYSVTKVDNERIMMSGTPVNALQSLYGSAAGLTLAGTATGPSGGMKINIRNAVSFDAASSTRPLIVVDGVPIHDQNSSISYNDRTGRDHGTGINDINPDDIASFEILKGAKASVLYGSEGANGVILITTKSGSRSRGLGVSASYTTSFDRPAFMPELQREYGTGRSPSNNQTDAQGFYLDENNVRSLDWSGASFGPKYDPSVQLKWWDGTTRPWVANDKTIYEQLFRNGQQNTANVELSSGSEMGSIRLSYTNMQMTPVFPSAEYDRNSLSVSANYDLNKFISVKYTGNYFITNNLNSAYSGSLPGQGAQASLGAYSADIDIDLIKRYLVTENGYNYFANPNMQNLVSTGRRSIIGSLWDWEQNESIFDRIHNIQSVTVDLTFNKTFSATLMGGLDNTEERNVFKGKLQDPTLIGPNSGSVFTDNSRIIRKTYGQGMLNFDTDISDINLSGFVGGIVRHNYLESKGATKIGGMVIPNYFSFTNLPSGVQPQYMFENGEDILYSALGSVQLAWKNQVYLEAQGRNDWSSILPPQNNSYFYPGVSATWIPTSSLDLPEVVEFVKLRASWADVGRPGPRYFSNVNLGVSQSGNGFIVVPPSHLPPMDDNFVPNLKPEKKREFEVGLEGYLFTNQRLGLDFSFYTSNTYNQIMAVTAPPGLGVSTIRMNAGDVANRGWELALKTKPIHTRDIKWNIDMTFSSSKTKVVSLDGNLSSLTLWSTMGLNAVAEVGGEYGLIYQARGKRHYINPSNASDPANGQLIVANNRAFYDYAATSNKMVGKLLPDLVGGMFSSFSYKNLRFVYNIDYSFGATFLSVGETYMMAAGVLKESLKYRDQESGGLPYYLNAGGQKLPGQNPAAGPTYYDGVVLNGVMPNGQVNTTVVSAEEYYYQSYFSNGFFPEDRLFKSDYIALRNIALDYSVPFAYSKMIGLNELVLSVFANNVAYLYKAAPNTIPESANGTGWGQDFVGGTALPAQRSIGVAVKIKL
jgi:TonB-linked SusC/RagA family outer membrane protein